MSIHGPESTVFVGGGGDVVGPASATDNHLAQFNGTTGKLLEGAGVAVSDLVPTSYLDTDGTLAANSDTKVATQKATKTYADTKAALSHTHAISDTTGLQAALDDRPTLEIVTANAAYVASLSWSARFRASDLSGNDGDTAATFTDISGNGNDATGSGSSRVLKKTTNGINGKAVVRLSSSGYFATSAGGQQFSAVPWYIAAVVRFNSDGVVQHVVCLGEDSTGKRRGLIRYDSNAWGYNGEGADVPSSAFQSLTVSTPYFLELISDGTTVTCLRNGVVMIAQPIGQTAYTNDVISLGKNNGSSEFLQGDLAEVFLAADTDVPSIIERERVRAYVATEYGITMPAATGDVLLNYDGTNLAESGIYSDGALVVVGDGAPATWGEEFGIEQVARVSVYGPLYAYNSRGEHLLESDDYYTNGTSANVLALRHKSAQGASAVRFLLASDGGEVAACGYVNGTGTYLSGSAFLAGSVPYPIDGSTVSSGDPAGVILGQEGFYDSVMRRVARVYCKPDWTIEFRDPLDAVIASMSPTGNFTIGTGSAIATTATAGFFRVPSCAGAPTGAAPNDSLIHDSTNNRLYLRSGGAWVNVGPGSGAGDLLAANNLSDVANAATARDNLGVEIGADVQAYSANLDEYAAVNPTAAGLALLDDADAAAQRTTLGLAIGTNVQAYSANLDEYAGVNPTTAGLALLDDADADAQRTTLGLGTAAVEAATAFAAALGADDNYVTDAEKTKLSNLSGTNTGDQTTITGNAGTATALQTGRTIDGVTFDGTTNITVIAPGTHDASSKATPANDDEIPLVDSAASNVLKKLTWANLKATAKTYFDTLYAPIGTPTIQKFTSSSGTYTTPAGVRWIRVRMVGGGGGGGGSGNASATAGGAGGNTTFGTTLLAANGGGGGGVTVGAVGGTGGTASLGTGPVGIALTGGVGSGNNGSGTSGGPYSLGGMGGVSPFGGGGGPSANGVGAAGVTNSGSGGGGGSPANGTASLNSGSGGGAGGFVDAIITSPSSTYSYAVGAAGSAGSAGTNGNAGGAGGSGVIIVEEHY